MSQHKKLELSDRVRAFRGRAKLSQEELGERLGVSGNYISMIELGKKLPGPSLRKLFESLEQASPAPTPVPEAGKMEASPAGATEAVRVNPLFSILSTETLFRSLAEVSEKLSQSDPAKQQLVIANLRVLLDELEQRLAASCGGLAEAPPTPIPAVKSEGSQATK